MRIRPATPADVPALLSLLAHLDAYHRAARPDLFAPAKRTEVDLAALLGDARATILVADRDDVLLGFVAVGLRDVPASPIRAGHRLAEIDNIVVVPEARRQGIGRALIAAASDWARDRAVDRLVLSVWAFNDEAIRFYTAAGFETLTLRLSRTP